MLGTVGGIYSRFNPRTYIRYDNIANFPNMGINVSIHVPI